VARRGTPRQALATLAALFSAALTVGCVSMPTGGPVQSYPVTLGAGAPNQPNVQFQPQKPRDGWLPQQIVQGFLAASASFGNSQVALQYLTPQEQKTWTNPTSSAVIYKNGPNVANPVYPATAKTAKTATVQVTGDIQATLEGSTYSVPSTQAAKATDAPPPFKLVKGPDGQWRISSAPPQVLLTSGSFANDYQLRNLYFFDPTGRYLVPDPIYVPLSAGNLMNGLVQDLITPPKDWLSGGATKTALPAGTKLSDVTVVDSVTALVNLTGAIGKDGTNAALLEQVSSQLLWTLSGSGQSGSTGAVQSVEVELDGHPWFPPGSQGNPVQQKSQSQNVPPTGASSVYYYLDGAGYLTSRQGTSGKTEQIEPLGTTYTQVAVSPSGRYLAALRDSTLYAGPVGGPLEKQGSGFAAMSWDGNDNLWTALGGQVFMFRVAATIRQPLGRLVQVPVKVNSIYGTDLRIPFTALRVAPDGVRVALVDDGDVLEFGAISGQQGQDPQIMLSQVQLSPPDNATGFTALTWYGPDNVITLAQPGPAATEYPVSGGTPTQIPVEPGMKTITASSGNLLIAGMTGGSIVADNSLTGAWMNLGGGVAPAYPG
jgi:lipoprotein LpqB-like beta-propeller protein/sporulation and spore germination protein